MENEPILEDLHGGSSEESDSGHRSADAPRNDADAGGAADEAADDAAKLPFLPGEMDVLGNGLLRKLVVREGRGRDSRPTQGDRVTVRCVAWLDPQPEGTEPRRQLDALCHEELQFTLGDGDVPPALDLCVALMELAECAAVRCHARYAYGTRGLPSAGIGGGAALRYELELLRVDDALDVAQMDSGARFAAADAKRARGNELFARDEFAMAINSYSKALRFVDKAPAAAAVEGQPPVAEVQPEAQLQALSARVHNNLAAAQLKIEAHDAALLSCERVLALQPDNVKALFRRGRALSAKGELLEALVALRRAVAVQPDNRLVLAEKRHVEAELRRCKRTSQALYRKMLGLSEFDPPGAGAVNGGQRRWWRRYIWAAVACLLVALSVSLATAAYNYNVAWAATTAGSVAAPVLSAASGATNEKLESAAAGVNMSAGSAGAAPAAAASGGLQ